MESMCRWEISRRIGAIVLTKWMVEMTCSEPDLNVGLKS